jgi:hypothetical protein
MPLLTGSKNIRANIKELTTGKVGSARTKAIHTIAKKHGISTKAAKFKQALAIAYSQAKKK